MNLLIIGSNFGLIHLAASIKSKKFNQIFICSPNIMNKNIRFRNKNNNYKKILKTKKINMIVIATPPKIQNDIISYLYYKKISPKYLFLEKPLLPLTIKFLKKMKKTKFLVDFIFYFSKPWKDLNNLAKNKKIINFDYKWEFTQTYFKNHKRTWKINDNQGGGLINFYLPHAIFNLFFLLEDIQLLKIIDIKKYKKKTIFLKLLIKSNKIKGSLTISNFSINNLHTLSLYFKDQKISIQNFSKNWLSGFRIVYNNENKYLNNNNKKTSLNLKNKIDRINILLNFYLNYKKYFSNKYVVKLNALSYKTFNFINIINKKIIQ
jgi:hypothetical protein